jgi:malonyl-CoA O-methyltransferase
MNHKDDRQLISQQHSRRRFDRAAPGFAEADFVHSVARQGLFERLAPMLIEPKVIVDLGCGVGAGATQLAASYPASTVIAVDRSAPMLQQLQQAGAAHPRISSLHAEAETLPLQPASVDLVFASLLLPWLNDPAPVFRRVAEVLRPGGLFLFSALGPDSLQELRKAWAQVDGHGHVHFFEDMHNVGDTLVRAGLADPVLDVDYLTVTYREPARLFRDLTAAGARNSLVGRKPSLTGRGEFHKMEQALRSQMREDTLPVTVELVYGHAWGVGSSGQPGEFRVDPAGIRRRF